MLASESFKYSFVYTAVVLAVSAAVFILSGTNLILLAEILPAFMFGRSMIAAVASWLAGTNKNKGSPGLVNVTSDGKLRMVFPNIFSNFNQAVYVPLMALLVSASAIHEFLHLVLLKISNKQVASKEWLVYGLEALVLGSLTFISSFISVPLIVTLILPLSGIIFYRSSTSIGASDIYGASLTDLEELITSFSGTDKNAARIAKKFFHKDRTAAGGYRRGRPCERRGRLGRGLQSGGAGQCGHARRPHPGRHRKAEPADVPPQLIVEARAAGRRLRLVTQVWRDPGTAGRVRGRVQARELPADHPLAPIGGESLGVLLHTDLMGDLLVAELGAMVPQTAYGVYADLLHVCRSR